MESFLKAKISEPEEEIIKTQKSLTSCFDQIENSNSNSNQTSYDENMVDGIFDISESIV